jgi:hypothetical protein
MSFHASFFSTSYWEQSSLLTSFYFFAFDGFRIDKLPIQHTRQAPKRCSLPAPDGPGLARFSSLLAQFHPHAASKQQ